VKLCKAAAKSRDGADDASPIVFLKHNVYDDEEEEVTELAKTYNVRVSGLTGGHTQQTLTVIWQTHSPG
jgi:hypothetical protein